MATVWNVLIVIGIIVVSIGMLRVIFAPWRGFMSFLMELMLLDWLGDILEALIDAWD